MTAHSGSDREGLAVLACMLGETAVLVRGSPASHVLLVTMPAVLVWLQQHSSRERQRTSLRVLALITGGVTLLYFFLTAPLSVAAGIVGIGCTGFLLTSRLAVRDVVFLIGALSLVAAGLWLPWTRAHAVTLAPCIAATAHALWARERRVAYLAGLVAIAGSSLIAPWVQSLTMANPAAYVAYRFGPYSYITSSGFCLARKRRHLLASHLPGVADLHDATLEDLVQFVNQPRYDPRWGTNNPDRRVVKITSLPGFPNWPFLEERSGEVTHTSALVEACVGASHEESSDL